MRPRRRRALTQAPPRGLVLDVHQRCREEGPGVRTLVLLKGCPLRCLWCHDPQDHNELDEGHTPLYRAMCNNCYNCLTGGCSGPAKDSDEADDADSAAATHNCGRCGSCVETCAQSSVQSIGKRTEVSEIIELLEEDHELFGDEGGLTISGGEPMSQFGFTAALLEAAHERGFHTCLATSGVAMPDQFDRVRPFVDQFIFDYKATDEMHHIQLTAISNDQILDNLRRLYQADAEIVLRCPMVPGVNDTELHLQGIAELSARYPNLQAIQLVVSPPAVRRRMETHASDYTLPKLKQSDSEREAKWLEILKANGCDRAVVVR